MGRKNKRATKGSDGKFEKFVKTFMQENNKNKNDFYEIQPSYSNKCNKTFEKQNYNNETTIDYSKRAKERLEYTKQRLDSLGIKYRVIDDLNTLMYCYRKSDDYVIKYYPSNGFIVGHRNHRGINSLILLLLAEPDKN